MKPRVKTLVGVLVGTVGFVAALTTLYVHFFSIEENRDLLEPPFDEPSFKELVLTASTSHPDTNYLRVGHLIIDGVRVPVEYGGLLVADKITMRNGGAIYGNNIYVVAKKIDNGEISSSGTRGLNGGDVFVASAQINGTKIVSNGKDGSDGENGARGSRGADGADGRDGRCGPGVLGEWRSPERGQDAGHGGNGDDGEDGGDGGSAGNITILTSTELTTPSVSRGGLGGQGGQGGAAGPGGKGGEGGRGCTGLGGTVSNQNPGKDGDDGRPGQNGRDGTAGESKIPTVKLISWHSVKDVYDEYGTDKEEFVSHLRQIRPGD